MIPEARLKKSQDATLLARQWTRSAIHQIALLATKSRDERIRLAANQELLNRGHGRPFQAIGVFAAGEDRPGVTSAVLEVLGLGQSAEASEPELPIIDAPRRVERALFAAGAWLRAKM